ncbi:12114_t:CDS:2 [Rhizophagus irregularis]|nr:12114_t:CDS:2 [Rhizophagus irregularis]
MSLLMMIIYGEVAPSFASLSASSFKTSSELALTLLWYQRIICNIVEPIKMLTKLSFGHVIKAVHVAKASALMEELQRSVEALNFSVMLVGRSMIQPKPNSDKTESGSVIEPSITVQLIETLGRGKGRSIGK